MKNLFVSTLLLISCSINVFAQDKSQGVVKYERKMNFRQMMMKQKHISQEEKDRMALMKDNTWDEKLKLYFSPEASFFTLSEEEDEANKYGYSWRQPEFKLFRDFKAERQTDVMEMFGKTYIIDDSLRTPTWRIKTQIKSIKGYICLKAIAVDSIKKTTTVAWFTDAIPTQAGPERMYGLPGLILELDINDGDVIITATDIAFKPVAEFLKTPKAKGKKLKEADYQVLIKKKIDEAEQEKSFPWGIRW